jgi:hypothetical protein
MHMAQEKISASITDLENKDLLRAVLADLTDLRTKYTALLVKLDADSVGGMDYAATLPVATAQLIE